MKNIEKLGLKAQTFMPFEAWKPTEVSWQAASNFLTEPEVELGLQELLDYVAPYFEAHMLCL